MFKLAAGAQIPGRRILDTASEKLAVPRFASLPNEDDVELDEKERGCPIRTYATGTGTRERRIPSKCLRASEATLGVFCVLPPLIELA